VVENLITLLARLRRKLNDIFGHGRRSEDARIALLACRFLGEGNPIRACRNRCDTSSLGGSGETGAGAKILYNVACTLYLPCQKLPVHLRPPRPNRLKIYASYFYSGILQRSILEAEQLLFTSPLLKSLASHVTFVHFPLTINPLSACMSLRSALLRSGFSIER